MLSHSHLTKPIGQIFSNLYPKYVVQCIGGDNLKDHVKVVPPITPPPPPFGLVTVFVILKRVNSLFFQPSPINMKKWDNIKGER
jgi:hypothetical protein